MSLKAWLNIINEFQTWGPNLKKKGHYETDRKNNDCAQCTWVNLTTYPGILSKKLVPGPKGPILAQRLPNLYSAVSVKMQLVL